MIKKPVILIILLIVSLNSAIISQVTEVSVKLTSNQQLAHDIFRELIDLNTTMKFGCTKASETMAVRLRTAGFPDKDVHLVGPAREHMNLVVRYHGKGKLPPILFIGHLDVVEALRQDWQFDPFIFREADGYFYGRGTTDMKNEDADMVINLIRLRKEGYVPDRDIIVALTEGEETGVANGIDWLLKNHRDLVEAEYCINPDAGSGDEKNGKHIMMEVQTSEKVYIDYSFEVKNKGGHSSLPVRDNAIYRLSAALDRLANYDFPIMMNETTRMYFEKNALQETGQTRADMLAMSKPQIDTAAARRLALSSPFYNSMMRTTCVATMLSAGHAKNALPQTAVANVNCRMHPDDNPGNVLATLKSVVADTMVKITCTEKIVTSPRSPLRKDIMDAVEKVTNSLWTGVIITPVMGTGASDGKYLCADGIPVYGISGMFSDMDDVRAHGKDERLGTKEFYEGTEFMYRFMKELTSK